ncbi:hypothetical protein GCM10010965_07090 [Caldalkalibacillus thermarum]|nr:hypothetical protein GCM10010965_07090 [Caldalkalibacillus thermarum]
MATKDHMCIDLYYEDSDAFKVSKKDKKMCLFMIPPELTKKGMKLR